MQIEFTKEFLPSRSRIDENNRFLHRGWIDEK